MRKLRPKQIGDIVQRNQRNADRRDSRPRQVHGSCKCDHAPAEHPDHTSKKIVLKIEIEGPGNAQKCQFEKDEPETADGQKLRERPAIGISSAVEIRRCSGKKHECRGHEIRDPAGEEDAKGGPSSGHARVDPYVVDGHQDHRDPAHKIQGREPCRCFCDICGTGEATETSETAISVPLGGMEGTSDRPLGTTCLLATPTLA